MWFLWRKILFSPAKREGMSLLSLHKMFRKAKVQAVSLMVDLSSKESDLTTVSNSIWLLTFAFAQYEIAFCCNC